MYCYLLDFREKNMDKRQKELSEGKINAGRGVAQEEPMNASNDTAKKGDKDDRPDERARKAGY